MNDLNNTLLQLPPTTILLIGIAATLALYLARTSGHKIVRGIFLSLYQSLKIASASLGQAANRIRSRNRHILLHSGRLQVEKDLNKEFTEITAFVQRDLGGYPAIQKQIQEQISVIQEDYHRTSKVSPPLPEWVAAVDAVAQLQKKGADTGVNATILEQIHASAELQHKANLKQQREASSERHKILSAMTASWRQLVSSVENTGNCLTEIIKRSERIDEHMTKYKEILAGSDAVERSLFSSALCQFAISALVIAIALGGAFFNFHLIALPMSEMVGSLHRVGGIRVADIAALVIICLEVTAGIFLLESLHITRLFPSIGSMENKMRRLIMIGAATTLIVLAGTEAALAFMRDQIAGEMSALRSSLSGTPALPEQGGVNTWIPLTANMILGFILPLALTMAVIPLEYLLQTGRSLFGSLTEWALRCLATLLRIIAILCRQAGKVSLGLYDLLIALPLWIEAQIRTQKSKQTEAASWTDESIESWTPHTAGPEITTKQTKESL